jgi:FlaA1/EpsC-like NDP-sugar epimerase
VPVLGDIRCAQRAVDVVERYRPDVVFHAAAYKCLALVEAHPVEAVATNVLATKHMVDAARSMGVERFVLFSTDKAVQPASILGQTKAVAEWIVASAGDEAPGTRYSSVRLGNVVDSSGSILPLFRKQIEHGGPLTVTDPRTTRYLMTAAEAAGLVIVAGAIGDSGGVFWLDLHPPVRILELARLLVRATPADIVIDFPGLRPGEKLHEQLFATGDDIVATTSERVFRSTMPRVDPAWLSTWTAALQRQVDRASAVGVRAALAEMHAAPEAELAASSAGIGW